MIITLVTPAFRRYDVTRLCLAQRAHLRDGLAGRDIELRCVVVADDWNLEIAEDFGFATLEAPNVLGRKLNDGIAYACEQGADWVCFCGSDDWLHPDLFEGLDGFGGRDPVISGRTITVVDLGTARLRHLGVNSRVGAPPWLIPRWALEPSGFRPLNDGRTRGMEIGIVLGLGIRPEWVFRDPHSMCRVGFKSPGDMSGYEWLSRGLGVGAEMEPWETLVERYPAWLVDLARETSEQMVMVAA